MQSGYGVLTSSPWKPGSLVLAVVTFCAVSAIAVGGVYSQLVDYGSQPSKPSSARGNRYRHAPLLEASANLTDGHASNLAQGGAALKPSVPVTLPLLPDLRSNVPDLPIESGQVESEQVRSSASDEKAHRLKTRRGERHAKTGRSERERLYPTPTPWSGYWSGFDN